MMLTYDDVMLDWALAEINSATFRANYDHPLIDAVRAELASAGPGSLTKEDKKILIRAVEIVRAPSLMDMGGPAPNWSFSREELPLRDVASFFRYSEQPLTIADDAARLRANPNSDRKKYEGTMQIVHLRQKGGKPLGTPIALVKRNITSPVLIEGYKRVISLLWDTALANINLPIHIAAEP